MVKTRINTAFDPVNLPVKNVQAIQTTRLSPDNIQKSERPFDEFNLGLHVNDDAIQVAKNRALLHAFLPVNAKIQWLEQVHGNHVEVITQHNNKTIVADAVITKSANLALAIMTADCLPILLASKNGDEIAAIHGGWRPLASNIIQQTLDKMTTANGDICAWLGPCIGEQAFEVGEEVKQAFVSLSASYEQYFDATDETHYFADLVAIARQILTSLGVKVLVSGHQCTFSNVTRYYSYRKENITGRMASIICIKSA